MKQKKVLITRMIPDEGIKMLKKKGYKIAVNPFNRVAKKKEIIAKIKEVDALLCLLTDKIDEEIMDAGDNLKIIANYAVGYNNIDLEAAKKRKIMVTNTPGPEISETVAEHVVALMFGLAHRIVESDTFTRKGKYKGWGPQLLLGTDITGKTIGIIGLGNIGKELAKRLSLGFGVKLLYTDLNRDKVFEKKYKAKYVTQKELLKNSDFVTLHVPLLKSTKHLISTKELKLMKDTAFLINTSRGPVVKELALSKALANGDIAGAALDVYECEPLIDCNSSDNMELRRMKNVILTPHTASATIETRQVMSVRAADNIIRALEGKKPKNLVKSK